MWQSRRPNNDPPLLTYHFFSRWRSDDSNPVVSAISLHRFDLIVGQTMIVFKMQSITEQAVLGLELEIDLDHD